jgi:soluble lytic murein transglycosylase-like protein
MDGIAAIEARVAEICSRFAPPTPPAPAAGPGGSFADHLRTAQAAPPASGASGEVDSWIEQAIARTGAPESWAPGLRAIAQHESSFNPSAANLSGANPGGTPLGLMQMLPSTFAAHAQPGHGDILDPVDNLSAAIDYIRGRYGSPDATPGLRALARGDHYQGY